MSATTADPAGGRQGKQGHAAGRQRRVARRAAQRAQRREVLAAVLPGAGRRACLVAGCTGTSRTVRVGPVSLSLCEGHKGELDAAWSGKAAGPEIRLLS